MQRIGRGDEDGVHLRRSAKLFWSIEDMGNVILACVGLGLDPVAAPKAGNVRSREGGHQTLDGVMAEAEDSITDHSCFHLADFIKDAGFHREEPCACSAATAAPITAREGSSGRISSV